MTVRVRNASRSWKTGSPASAPTRVTAASEYHQRTKAFWPIDIWGLTSRFWIVRPTRVKPTALRRDNDIARKGSTAMVGQLRPSRWTPILRQVEFVFYWRERLGASFAHRV